MPTPVIQHRDRPADDVSELKPLDIGASAVISGIIVHREAENTFRFRCGGEAMLGSAVSVVDWIEHLKKEMSPTVTTFKL